MKKIFDDLEEQENEQEIMSNFERGLSTLFNKYADKERREMDGKIISDVKAYVHEEMKKIQPVQKVIERQVEQVVKHEQIPVHLEPKVIKTPAPPPQIIREVRIEVPKKDDRKLIEEKDLAPLNRRIEELVNELEKVKNFSRGGSGVIGIPPPEPNPTGYVLTVNSDRKAQWKAATGGSGGGLAPGTFSISNNTPSYSLDPTSDTIDNLYQVVATLIRKLQGEI